jgi:hypothetical protein
MNVTVTLSYDPASTEERKALAGVLGMLGAMPPLSTHLPSPKQMTISGTTTRGSTFSESAPPSRAEEVKAIKDEVVSKRKAKDPKPAPTVSKDDLKLQLRVLGQMPDGFDASRKVLQSFKAVTLDDLKPADYAAVLDALKAAAVASDADDVDVDADVDADEGAES